MEAAAIEVTVIMRAAAAAAVQTTTNARRRTAQSFFLPFVASFFLSFTVALIVVGALSPLEQDVCDSITDLNRGEQRICQTKKTEAVFFSTGATKVTAYRDATKDLPPTETRIIRTSHSATARTHGYLYFDFALSAGGTINLSCVFGCSFWPKVADLYLMTSTQFNAFQRRHQNTVSFCPHWRTKCGCFIHCGRCRCLLPCG